MKKKKLFFILGIVIIIAGVGIFLYPIISQAYASHKQKQIMQEVKEEIFKNMFDDTQAVTPDVPDTADTSSESSSDVTSETASDADSSESETASASSTHVKATPTPAGIAGIGVDGSTALDTHVLVGGLTEGETIDENPLDRSRLSGQKCMGIITIEAIDLVYAIVEGVDDYNIGVAIGHFPDSVGIGEEGNCSLAGHNGGTYGRYFGDIKNLKEGDEVVMTNLKGEEYTYVVTDYFVVEPTELSVVEDLGVKGKYLTMVTCTQHGTKRLIVRAQCTTDPVSMKGF